MLRTQNIIRNEEFLSSIGVNVNSDDSRRSKGSKRSNKNDQNHNDNKLKAPTRKSSRLTESYPPAFPDINSESIAQRRGIYVNSGDSRSSKSSKRSNEVEQPHIDNNLTTVNEAEFRYTNLTSISLRAYINIANPEHSSNISNAAIVHCVDRIRSMSAKAIKSHVQSIKR